MATGPETELERLYRSDGGRLWRSLVGFTGDPDLAEDAVAEAFAQALGRGDAIRDPARWVWRAAFRIASGELAARSRHLPFPDNLSREAPEPPSDLLRVLRELPRRQRAVIVLHHYAGYSTREVAFILGMTSATVRVHASQGRRRLARLLEVADDA